jgi:trehalose 6-phosphate phosphatase
MWEEYTREWAAALRGQLPSDPGIVLEEKRYSLTVHYRHARDTARARKAIAAAARTLRDARLVDGTFATNILPRGGPDKGVALQLARRVFACDTAIYVGDDETDEPAFASGSVDRLLSVRVGAGPSHARYRLTSQADIDRLLRALIALRGTCREVAGPKPQSIEPPRRRSARPGRDSSQTLSVSTN